MSQIGALWRSPAAIVVLVILLLLASREAFAKQLGSDFGFFVDMPSGFVPGEGDGKTRFSYSDPNGGMEFDIRVYQAGRFDSAEAIAVEVATKLSSTGDTESFIYEGRRAVLAELSFTLNGAAKKGYAVYILGRPAPPASTAAISPPATSEAGSSAPAPSAPDASAPTASAQGSQTAIAPPPPERDFALLAFADAARFDAYSDLILSCLDSFSIDSEALRNPGPLSQFVLPWPPKETKTKAAVLPDGSTVELPWSDEEAAQEVDTADREYHVLESYEQTQDLWVDAWARFYRMVYRESAARLDRLSLEFARVLPLDDPTECARRVLAWVQGFTYQRDLKGIDFVTPLYAAFERRGDCDSRALVMTIILERLGIHCVLMLSREYSHAMVGVDVPGGGQRFPWKGTNYLVAETTAKVGLGMIAASQADFKKWMGVELEWR
jgi:hypothetical protein